MNKFKPQMLGYSFSDGTGIFIGTVPYRKSKVLMIQDGSVISVVAYFRNPNDADWAVKMLEKLVNYRGDVLET